MYAFLQVSSYLVMVTSYIASVFSQLCSLLLLNSIQMSNGYWKYNLCLQAASALKWSVFSQFFTELHTTLLKDPNKTKSGLWELKEALLKRLLLAVMYASTEIETSISLLKAHPSHPVGYKKLFVLKHKLFLQRSILMLMSAFAL